MDITSTAAQRDALECLDLRNCAFIDVFDEVHQLLDSIPPAVYSSTTNAQNEVRETAVRVLGQLIEMNEPETLNSRISELSAIMVGHLYLPRVEPTLWKMWTANRSVTEQALREEGLANRRAEVRLATVRVLNEIVDKMHGRVAFHKFTPLIVRLLRDSDEKVRLAAFDLLVSFFSTARADARQHLMSQMQKMLISEDLQNKLAQHLARYSPPQNTQSMISRTNTPPTHGAGPSVSSGVTGGSQTVIKLEFLHDAGYARQPMPPMGTREYMLAELKKGMVSFNGKESEHNWAARDRVIKLSRGLLRCETDNLEMLHEVFKLVLPGFASAIHSLRSTLAVGACQAVKDYAQVFAHQPGFTEMFDSLLEPLAKLAANIKKLMSSASNLAMCAIMYGTPDISPKMFAVVSQESRTMKTQVRVFALQWLLTLAVAVPQSLPARMSEIEAIVTRAVSDAAPDGRVLGRELYWYIHGKWPQTAQRIMQKMDAAAVKNINRGRSQGQQAPPGPQVVRPMVRGVPKMQDSQQLWTPRPMHAVPSPLRALSPLRAPSPLHAASPLRAQSPSKLQPLLLRVAHTNPAVSAVSPVVFPLHVASPVCAPIQPFSRAVSPQTCASNSAPHSRPVSKPASSTPESISPTNSRMSLPHTSQPARAGSQSPKSCPAPNQSFGANTASQGSSHAVQVTTNFPTNDVDEMGDVSEKLGDLSMVEPKVNFANIDEVKCAAEDDRASVLRELANEDLPRDVALAALESIAGPAASVVIDTELGNCESASRLVDILADSVQNQSEPSAPNSDTSMHTPLRSQNSRTPAVASAVTPIRNSVFQGNRSSETSNSHMDTEESNDSSISNISESADPKSSSSSASPVPSSMTTASVSLKPLPKTNGINATGLHVATSSRGTGLRLAVTAASPAVLKLARPNFVPLFPNDPGVCKSTIAEILEEVRTGSARAESLGTLAAIVTACSVSSPHGAASPAQTAVEFWRKHHTFDMNLRETVLPYLTKQMQNSPLQLGRVAAALILLRALLNCPVAHAPASLDAVSVLRCLRNVSEGVGNQSLEISEQLLPGICCHVAAKQTLSPALFVELLGDSGGLSSPTKVLMLLALQEALRAKREIVEGEGKRVVGVLLAAMSERDASVRKEVYPALVTVCKVDPILGESAAQRMSTGQRRLLEHMLHV